MKLAEHARDWHRRWSVQIGLIASAITTVLIASPDALQVAWTTMPPDLRALLPQRFMPLIGVGLFVLSMFAQLMKQTKLQIQREAKPDA